MNKRLGITYIILITILFLTFVFRNCPIANADTFNNNMGNSVGQVIPLPFNSHIVDQQLMMKKIYR